MTEDRKRQITRWLVIIGWTGTLALAALRIIGVIDAQSREAQLGGLLIVVALWGGIARSRFILSDTITGVFRAGIEASRAMRPATRIGNDCIVRINENGRIDAVENAEALGLDKAELLNKPIDALLPRSVYTDRTDSNEYDTPSPGGPDGERYP